MSHVRKQIRDAVVAEIASLGTVKTLRVYPNAEGALPVFLVSTGAESLDGNFDALERSLSVIVECIVRGDTLDDAIDECIAQVEATLGEQTLGGLVVHLVLTSIEITESGEGAAPIGRARMTYTALYRTSFTDPETSI